MRKLLLVLPFLFILQKSFSNSIDCAMSAMTFLPEEKEISLNSMFVIEGYGYSQKTINSFKSRKVFLVSNDGSKIELILQKTLKGQMELTQAIFKPLNKLEPNKTYFLAYENQTENEKNEMLKWNSKTKQREKVHWKTSNTIKLENINPNLKIDFQKTEVRLFGCGPSSNAIFKVKNKSSKEIWYKTELIDLSTNKKSVYYIREWKDTLRVGHGMCAGAFTFDSKRKYKVRFTPMNTDGKKLKTTKWIIFNSPENKNPLGF